MQEIGTDSFRVGREALTGRRYRSSVSRFYYAAFSLLTYELVQAGVDIPRFKISSEKPQDIVPNTSNQAQRLWGQN